MSIQRIEAEHFKKETVAEESQESVSATTVCVTLV